MYPASNILDRTVKIPTDEATYLADANSACINTFSVENPSESWFVGQFKTFYKVTSV